MTLLRFTRKYQPNPITATLTYSHTHTHVPTEQHGNTTTLVKTFIYFAIQQPTLAIIEDVQTVIISKGKQAIDTPFACVDVYD